MPNDSALINWGHLSRFASNLKDKFDDIETSKTGTYDYISYAKLITPDSISNNHVLIKAKFPDGVVNDDRKIRIYKNGTEIKRSIIPSFDENKIENTNYYKYPSGYINAVYIAIIDSASDGQKYEIRVTNDKKTLSSQVAVEQLTDRININTNSGIQWRLTKASNYSVTHLKYSGVTYAVINCIGFFGTGSSDNHKENDSNFVSSYITKTDVDFYGDGETLIRCIRTIKASQFTAIHELDFWANGELTSKVSFIPKSTCTYKTMYQRFQLGLTSGNNWTVNESGNNAPYPTVATGVGAYGSISVSPLYTIANSQRDDQSLTKYSTYRSVSGNGANSLNIMLGASLDNTNTWSDKIAPGSEIVLAVGTKDQEYMFNMPFGTMHSKSHANFDYLKVVNLAYILYKLQLSKYGTGNRFIKYTLPYYYLAGVKLGLFGSVIAYSRLNKMMTEVYGGSDKNAIASAYATDGLQFVGRSMPVAYHIYFLGINTQQCAGIVEAYGDFLLDLWNEYNDIPLLPGAGGNSNSRGMGLYGLTIAKKVVGGDKYDDAIDGLIEKINDTIEVGTIIPENSIYTSRYLHYTAFANYYYSLAMKLLKTDSEWNNYSYLSQSVLPHGQIKDATFCSSDSRRGLSSTYAYIIGNSLLSDDSGITEDARRALDWITDQYKSDDIPTMLDNYTSYTGNSTNVENLCFATVALLDSVLDFKD